MIIPPIINMPEFLGSMMKIMNLRNFFKGCNAFLEAYRACAKEIRKREKGSALIWDNSPSTSLILGS